MDTIINLYSDKSGEISKFLNNFYKNDIKLSNDLKWEKVFKNPIEMVDLIGVFIDNKDKFDINMWISLDQDAFIYINDDNADNLIRYLYERYPY